VATTLPLPTTLGGVQVKVKDGNNIERDAGLFFISAGQINLLVPQGTSTGSATITVLRNGTTVGAGTLEVAAVSPGMFTFSGTGQGLAAANIFRLKADGSQSFEPIAQFNASAGRFDPIPIDLGPESDQVFLIAFGTGLPQQQLTQQRECDDWRTTAEVLLRARLPVWRDSIKAISESRARSSGAARWMWSSARMARRPIPCRSRSNKHAFIFHDYFPIDQFAVCVTLLNANVKRSMANTSKFIYSPQHYKI
jgi:hypothetical protein